MDYHIGGDIWSNIRTRRKAKLPSMAMVLDVLASYVQNMVTEMAKEEVYMLLGVSGEIKNMDDKLGDLKNFLADADRRNITDESVQAWVRELREAMYDATDILDLCQLKAMEQGPRLDAGCLNPLLFCMRNPLHAHNIGIRIKILNKRLDGIKKRSADFNFINLSPYKDHSSQVSSSRIASHDREESPELIMSGLVGEKIEEDTKNLVEMLTKEGGHSHDGNKIMVFAIVGVGGIGKTTLAKKIINNEVIEQEFTKKIWLSVNQEFSDVELLRRTIIAARGYHQAHGNTKEALVQTLKDALKGHKILLVMDDVWSHNVWERVLETPLFNSVARGSRILVTTRDDTVARGMKAVKPYHRVAKLEREDAWCLLKKQVVGRESEEPQVEMLKDIIGMGIIEKCDCLPLAVKVMGGLLGLKEIRRGEWENVLNDSIWSVSPMPEDLNYAIYLSYQDLEPTLKPCFLHYSLLPKSTMFSVHDIIGMWISEGFVHGNSRDIEETGREYYNQLILRNLIEQDINFTDREVCYMHDVVRWFAQYMARFESLVAHNNESDISDKLKYQKFIRLSLETKGSKSNELEWSSLQAHTSLRSLILVGDIKIQPGDSLDSFSSLRTLHIESAKIDALTESLSRLRHLRYLSLIGTKSSGLPENIGNMKFLQHINLTGSDIVNLPDSITKLQQLRFLCISPASINSIPRCFSGLTNLRKLYGFPVNMGSDWCSLEELGPLSKLTGLYIRDLENVSSPLFAIKARLREKVHLSYLGLRCTHRHGDDRQLVPEKEQGQIEEVFNELCPPPCLEFLLVDNYFGMRLPRWMMSTAVSPLRCLRNLKIEHLPYCTDLPDALCELPSLEFLQIDDAPAIHRVGPQFLQPYYHHRRNLSQVVAVFPRLRRLELIKMVAWEEWVWEEQVQAMPVLEELVLERCKLRCIPPGLSIHTRSLRKLYVSFIENLSSLENFSYIVYLEVVESPGLERISGLPKLQKLKIVKCPKIKVLEGLPALERLELKEYYTYTLPKYLLSVNPRHLQLDCRLRLLGSIATMKSGPEWDKLSHIQHFKAYASRDGIPRKWYVLYTRDPFNFETNMSRSAIAQGRLYRKNFTYISTCTIEDEWPVGQGANRRQPLCQRFR
ncbi:putative disease resistance protein RGA4 [Dichanthelium oligosanthes]|uniref:Putative disease resistance protein RGA4 n=1 Tax=Dichanthelium oligosanthes TaxID=888268 RepID=A0A1E5VAG1_9POAL|nr:putative disease resistance protein RGA4 [Dichanthelium oligosanthes]